MFVKSVPATVKAIGEADGLDEGIFTAIVSVFGNVDSAGDRVMPGAFQKTLAEWEASGNPIPVYYSHRIEDPDYNIGAVLEAKELLPGDELLPEKLADYGGLWVKAQIDLHEDAVKARQVYRLMKEYRLTQFSFMYDVVVYKITELGKQRVWYLQELKLHEVGPTPLGANSATELIDVKSVASFADRLQVDVKAGRTISAKNEGELRAAYEALGRVLEAVEGSEGSGTDSDAGNETVGDCNSKTDEPSGVKADARDGIPASQVLLRIGLEEASL